MQKEMKFPTGGNAASFNDLITQKNTAVSNTRKFAVKEQMESNNVKMIESK